MPTITFHLEQMIPSNFCVPELQKPCCHEFPLLLPKLLTQVDQLGILGGYGHGHELSITEAP